MKLLNDLFSRKEASLRAENFMDFLTIKADFDNPVQADLAKQYIEQIITEYSPRTLSRRYLAWAICLEVLLLFPFGVVIYPFNAAWGDYIFKMLAGVMGAAFLSVVGLYFGKETVKDWINSVKGGK